MRGAFSPADYLDLLSERHPYAAIAAYTPADMNLAEAGKPAWETPKLEDVSEQVMAQPYIRFT